MPLKKPGLKSLSAGAAFAAATFLAPMVEAQDRSAVWDLNKSFNMEVQLTPFSNPRNPASRTVNVECGKLGVNASGHPAYTGSFLDAFDLPPYRAKNPNENDVFAGSAAIQHIGSRRNPGHEICVAQAESLENGVFNQKDGYGNIKQYNFKLNGKTYYTSVPYTDDRYCPPLAAMKICSNNKADDAYLSPIYRIKPNGDVVLAPENL